MNSREIEEYLLQRQLADAEEATALDTVFAQKYSMNIVEPKSQAVTNRHRYEAKSADYKLGFCSGKRAFSGNHKRQDWPRPKDYIRGYEDGVSEAKKAKLGKELLVLAEKREPERTFEIEKVTTPSVLAFSFLTEKDITDHPSEELFGSEEPLMREWSRLNQ